MDDDDLVPDDDDLVVVFCEPMKVCGDPRIDELPGDALILAEGDRCGFADDPPARSRGEDEVCDDGVNDGSYGGCNPDCMSLTDFCGDGEINGPEACDDGNDDAADGCIGDCTVPTSCAEILAFDNDAPDGDYVIAPKPDTPWMATCDMTTDGGGWTGITIDHTCNGDLDTTITAIEPAPDEGVDMMCRPFTTDLDGAHTYTMDIEFPPGIDEFYLSNYTIKARAIDPSRSEIQAFAFIQTTWDVANFLARGDVSFGSANEPGPTTSYAAEDADFTCIDCEEPFPTLDTPFVLAGNTTTFRIGWGELGIESEGWFPWYEGTIFVR